MWQEFKKFIARGNVIDLAVGIIMGAAFIAIVNSLVKDIVMPPIGWLIGGADFTDLFILLSQPPDGTTVESLAQAQELGLATINYGVFINAVINFLIVAIAVFFLVKAVNRLQERVARGEEPEVEAAAPTTEEKLLEAINELTAAIKAQK
jgi:large conductance mechanosensitive channel